MRRTTSAKQTPQGRLPVRRAFSLIELLVVLAIISILAALTLPALNSARESGRVSYCSNNISEIGKALALYTGEHDNRYPPVYADTNSWDQALLQYLGSSRKMFRCPSDPYIDKGNTNAPRTYAVNGMDNKHPFGSYPNPPDGDGPLRTADLDYRDEKTDIILVGEGPGDSEQNRGYVGEQPFASLDEKPGKVHRERAGGNYLFSSMAIRYLESSAVAGGDNYWTVE